MNPLTYPKPAQARCYKCGSPEIEAICHHCGRVMCNSHAKARLPVRVGLWCSLSLQFGWKKLSDPEFSSLEPGFSRLSLQEEIFSALRLAKLENPEFCGFFNEYSLDPNAGLIQRLKFQWWHFRRHLDLAWGRTIDRGIATPYHCEFCVHNVSSYSNVMWAALILTLTFFGSIIGLPLFIIGYWLNLNYFINAQGRQLPLIPLEGTLEQRRKIRIRESVTGQIELDASGEYVAQKDEAFGRLFVPLHFSGSAYERYRSYLQKAKHLRINLTQDPPICAGYMVMGPTNWDFTSGNIWLSNRVNVVALQGTVKNSPLTHLLTDPNQTEKDWEIEYSYRIPEHEDRSESILPVQVVISIYPESNRQALALEVELLDLDIPKISKTTIEQFTLWAPNFLGRIERVVPEGKIAETAGEREKLSGESQSITWKRLTFEATDEGSYRRSIYIQFQNPIELETRLEGELELHIPAPLSGAGGFQFFTPWGKRQLYDHEHLYYDSRTTLKVSLDLDLGGLRYQNLETKEKKILREGLVPDSRLVAELVDVISEQDFYVKRVTENPARTSKEGAHKINKYWDIIGRKYEGVYPIDFHLVLTGEEILRGSGGVIAGQLQIEVTVQGAVTNDEMRGLIENISEQLEDLICENLDKIPLAAFKSEYTSEDSDGRVNSSQTDIVQTQGTPVIVHPTEQLNVEILKPVILEERMETIRKLQGRLDLLEERLLEGALSEDTFLSMKAKYEQELWDLSDGTLGKPLGKKTPRRRSS